MEILQWQNTVHYLILKLNGNVNHLNGDYK